MDSLTRLPRAPAISSLTSASREIALWLAENDYSQLSDGDGLIWRVELASAPRPNPGDPHLPLWEIRLGVSTEVTASELIGAGVLDPIADARMVALIGERTLPFSRRPQVIIAAGLSEARRQLLVRLPELKAALLEAPNRSQKRDFVARWLDQNSAFAAKGL